MHSVRWVALSAVALVASACSGAGGPTAAADAEEVTEGAAATAEPRPVAEVVVDGPPLAVPTAVAAVPGGWLVAGRAGEPGTSAQHAVLWRSADGVDWPEEGEPLPGGEQAVVDDVAVDDADRVLLVGSRWEGDRRVPAAWLDDGDGWSPVDLPALDDEVTDATIGDVAPTDEGGFVAVGWQDTPEAERALFLRSDDGETWELGVGPEGEVGVAASGVADGPAGLVAVGERHDSPTGGHGVSWLSEDGGRTWVASDAGLTGSDYTPLDDVVLDDDRYVAVGASHDGQGHRTSVYESTDGTSWSRRHDIGGGGAGNADVAGGSVVVAGGDAIAEVNGSTFERVDPVRFQGGPTYVDVATDGEHVVAVGYEGDQPTVWRFGPGVEDRRLGPTATDSTAALAVVPFGDGYVAVGSAQRPGRRTGLAWLGTNDGEWEEVARVDEALFDDVLVTPEGLVAVGRRGFEAGAWTSPDGSTWTPAETTFTGVHGFGDVVAFGGGLLALGSEDAGRDTTGSVWRSDDGGRTWARLAFDASTFPDSVGIEGLCVAGDRLLLVGAVDGLVPQGRAWTSGDGASWAPVADLPATVFRGCSSDALVVGESYGGSWDVGAWTLRGADLAPVVTEPLAATQDGLVAVGTGDGVTVVADRHGDLALVRDGEWSWLSRGPASEHVQDAVADGDSVVAVGSVEGRAAFWVHRPA